MKKFLSVFFILICIFMYTFTYAQKTYQNIADNVVRLHIVANSNSNFDQNIKLKLRDKFLSSVEFEADNIVDLKKEIKHKIPQINKLANDFLLSQQVDYTAQAQLCLSDFPTREYADIKLPGGEYVALKILLGDACGENWWCVMFPPLCFTDTSTGCIDFEYADVLKNSLSDEEYRLITSDDTDVQIKFKIIEIINLLKNIRGE